MNIKRIIGTVLTTTLLIGLLPTGQDVQANTSVRLSDLNEAQWANKFITKMYIRNIVKGYEDGTFKPNKQINQLEAVTMIINYLGYNDDAEQYKNMDVTNDPTRTQLLKGVPEWGKGFVLVAYELKLIDIDSKANFKPLEPASRGWIVTVLVGAVKKHGALVEQKKVSFSDEAQIPDWAYNPVMEAARAEIMKGYEDGTFKANNVVTRAEMTTFMSNAERYLKPEVKKDIISGTVEIKNEDSIVINIGQDQYVKKYFSDSTPVFFGTNVIGIEGIKVGDKISGVLTGSDSLVYIDVLEGLQRTENTIKGEVLSLDTINLLISIKDSFGKLSSYKIDNNTTVKLNGLVTDIYRVMPNDQVELRVYGDNASEITILDKYKIEESAEVVSVNETLKALTVKVGGSTLAAYSLTNVQIFDQNGENETIASIRVGDRLTLQKEADRLVSIKLSKYKINNALIKTIYTGSRQVNLNYGTTTKAFTISSDAVIELKENVETDFNQLMVGDIVNVVVKDNRIVNVDVLNRKRINYIYQTNDPSALSIKVQSIKDQTYSYLKYDAALKPSRNGVTLTSFDELFVGELLVINVDNSNKITKVEATSLETVTIQEINATRKQIKLLGADGKTKSLYYSKNTMVYISNVRTDFDKLTVGDYVNIYSLGNDIIQISK